MRSARALTLHFLIVLSAAACGGRSSIQDESARFDDASDGDSSVGSGGKSTTGGGGHSPTAGGSSSGGRAASSGGVSSGGVTGGGGVTSSGGIASGAAASGGAGGTIAAGGAQAGGGSDPGCAEGTFDDGGSCEPWTECQPGYFLVVEGTRTSDRRCAPCPAEGNTFAPNEPSCAYVGCAFGERVLAPATANTEAECEPDPHYHESSESYQFVDLTQRRSEHAYAGWQSDTDFVLETFVAGALVDTRTFARDLDKPIRGFSLAPDETLSLMRADAEPPRLWVEAYSSSGTLAWTNTLGSPSAAHFIAGLFSSDSHWFSWRYDTLPNFSSGLLLQSSVHGEFSPAPPASVQTSGRPSIAADDDETIWLVGDSNDGKGTLVRVIAESVVSFVIAEEFSPEALAVAPLGSVYVVGQYEPDFQSVTVFELDKTGGVQKTFSLSVPAASFIVPLAIAVDPSRAVYVACRTGYFGDSAYQVSRSNVLLGRIDLVSDIVSTQLLVGPNDDSVSALAVTSDGSVYAGGETDGRPYVRKVY